MVPNDEAQLINVLQEHYLNGFMSSGLLLSQMKDFNWKNNITLPIH